MRIDLQQAVTLESAREAVKSCWGWWMGELLALMPPGWSAAIVRYTGRPRMRRERDCWLLSWPGREDTISIEAALPVPAFRNALIRALGHTLREPVSLELGARDVLRRTVRLPRGAGARLRAAIGLQIERLCPFRADAVAFDYRTDIETDDSSEIAVEVAIVPLAVLAEYEAWLDGVGLSVAQFESDGRFRFPPTAWHWRRDPRFVAGALAAAGVALWVCAFLLAPSLRASELERESARLAAMRGSASEALNAKDALDGLTPPLALVAQKESEAKPLDVLKAVSMAFPPTAQLRELVVDGNQVRASGTSVDAGPLIGALRRAPHIVTANLIGPLEPTSHGMDRFTVALTVRP
jgi:hypothetical protein